MGRSDEVTRRHQNDGTERHLKFRCRCLGWRRGVPRRGPPTDRRLSHAATPGCIDSGIKLANARGGMEARELSRGVGKSEGETKGSKRREQRHFGRGLALPQRPPALRPHCSSALAPRQTNKVRPLIRTTNKGPSASIPRVHVCIRMSVCVCVPTHTYKRAETSPLCLSLTNTHTQQ